MSSRSVVLASLLTSALALPAAAVHFSVAKSSPAAGQALEASPKRVQIWFSQVPAAGVSSIKLHGADKTEVALGKTVIEKDSKSMYAELADSLKPGAYIVSWRAAGDDGHVQTGEIKFTVAKAHP